MVSRVVVDSILIAGLVVGTLGVLCLSYGILGRSQFALLRWLLIALALCTFFTLANLVTGSSLKDGITWGLGNGLLYTLLGALSNRRIYRRPTSREVVISTIQVFFFLLALNAIWYLVLPWVGLIVFDPPITLAQSVMLAGLWALLGCIPFVMVVVLGNPYFPLTERQLQVIGLLLTLVGISTQFVSPILDLMNVRVG